MNKKKIGLIIIWSCLFIIVTASVLVTISFHSTELITKTLRVLLIVIGVLSMILLGYGIILMIDNKYYLTFKKLKNVIITAALGTYVAGSFMFLFLMYGPIDKFRSWLITTAMATMNHKYLCSWFYSLDEINAVLSENYIAEFDEDTDADMVKFNENSKYKNEYEKEILEHKKGDLYKIIKFKVNGQQAYLAAVYDPSKISVGISNNIGYTGQMATGIAKDNKAVLAINGGGFSDPEYRGSGGDPIGVTISHGKIITDYAMSNVAMIGFNNDNVLVLKRSIKAKEALNQGIRDAVSMAPLLIVNGKPAFTKGNGGWGYAARTAIGQREDGIVLFLVVDSNVTRTKGASMVDLTEIMQRYGAINAANLDGGTSSVMVENYEIINDPIDSSGRHRTRRIPTIFMVKE